MKTYTRNNFTVQAYPMTDKEYKTLFAVPINEFDKIRDGYLVRFNDYEGRHCLWLNKIQFEARYSEVKEEAHPDLEIILPEIISEGTDIGRLSTIKIYNNGVPMKRVKKLNTHTLEAEIYKVGENNKVVTKPKNPNNPSLFPRFEGDLCGFEIVTETVQLKNVKIVIE